MDVRAWLQETTDREPPDEEDRAGFPDYLHPQRYTAEEHTRAHQGKRKRASSEPHSPQKPSSQGRHGGHERAAAHGSSSDHVRGARTDTASSRNCFSGARREPSRDRRFNGTFERRKRYKTREDRYEPKAKTRRKLHQSRQDHKTKSKRRKSHRSGDGARTAGLVTSFQLKDRPKNNRLTLRPADVSAGIFKHGRAGAPITGNGSGLPDLVFNEMRFLRRPGEHQDEIPADHNTKNLNNIADKQHEGNISSYFAKPRGKAPKSHEEHPLIPAPVMNDRHHLQDDQDAVGSFQQRENRSVQGPADRPANSFLGFGSRGPNQEVNNASRRSGSCYTWSEPVPAPKSPAREFFAQTIPKTHNATHTVERESLRRPRSATHREESSKSLEKRPRPAEPTRRWVHRKRAQGSALVELSQPAAAAQTSNRGDVLPTRKRSSLSLPRSGMGPPPPPPGRHAINHGQTRGSCPTSDILRIRDDCRDNGNQSAPVHDNILCNRDDGKENEEPSTSTPTSELLRHALQTIPGPHLGEQGNAQWTYQDDLKNYTPIPSMRQHGHDTLHRRRYMAADSGAVPSQSSKQQALGMPERGFSRSTDAPHATQRQLARPATRAPVLMYMATALPFATHQVRQSHEATPDDAMLDNFANHQLSAIPSRQQYTFTHSRQAEDLVRRLALDREEEYVSPDVPEGGYLPTPSEGLGDFSAYMPEVGEAGHLQTDIDAADFSTEQPCGQMWSNIDTPYTAPDPGRGEAQRDSMPGFWKPNKLY